MVDPRRYARLYRFDAKSPKSWLLSAALLVVGAALAAVAVVVGLVLAVGGMIALPFLRWRRGKAPEHVEHHEGDPKVIDVEYEIKRTE